VGHCPLRAFLYYLPLNVIPVYGLQLSIQAEFPLWHSLSGWEALSIHETLKPIITAF